jgi:hypothetical protein
VTRYKSTGKSVHFTRNFEVRSLFFPAESHGALRNFFSKVAATDQEQITLQKMGTKGTEWEGRWPRYH